MVAGLDGIRAFAVLAVIAYHSNFPWMRGGYYGVDTFFVLSGFLITSLLVAEWQTSRTVRLTNFWLRRARRLLPALFVLILVIGAACAIWPTVLSDRNLFETTLASVFYFSNWNSVAAHANYFNATTPPSPLLHTWSLAIEEQFYLVWPLVLLAIFRFTRPRRSRSGVDATPASDRRDVRSDNRRLETLMVLSIVGAVTSVALMAVLAPHGGDVNRVYYGTDTRAQGLLVGAALAAAFARWRSLRVSVQRPLAGLALLGVVAVGAMWALVPEGSTLAFHGGFMLASLGTAAVVAGVVRTPRGPVAAVLGWGPIRGLGRISYGVYLWYWPVLLIMTPRRVHLGGYELFAAQMAVIITIAAISYTLVETPIRRGVALAAWRGLVSIPVAVGASLVVAQVATFAPSAVASVPLSVPTSLTSSDSPPVKVLLVGDSMAGTLGVGLGLMAPSYGIQLMNEGSPGCSVSTTGLVKDLWYTLPPGKPCETGDPGALFSRWSAWVDTYNPDVVVYLARSDLLNQQVNGKWTHPGQPLFDQYFSQRLQQAIDVLDSKGAAVVLLTTPVYEGGDAVSGSAVPEDDPRRVVVVNAAIQDAAERAATDSSSADVSAVDLGGELSPNGRFTMEVNGVQMRCRDGIHITVAGGEQLARSLLPRFAAAGRVHQRRSPQGAWSGPPPPVVPSWFSRSLCD